MNTNLAENNVVGMDGKPFEPGIIEGTAKLTKDGRVKKTHTNAKQKRSTWVDPIRNKDDIKKCVQYLQSKIENEPRADYRKGYARNKLYFCVAVFSGFRVSDLIGARNGTEYKNNDGSVSYPEWTGLKWQDIYCKDGKTFRKEVTIKELKTSHKSCHIRKVLVTPTMQKYFAEYVEKFNPDTKSDDYIFINRQKERLGSKSIDNMIKDIVSTCGIEGKYSTHSLRKTYVYHKYMSLCENDGEQLALAKTIKCTGHRSIDAFLRYLGLDEKETEEDSMVMEDYFEDIF